jgi:hypothetical protein
MIACDKCEEWFHAECFNINLLEIVDIEHFPFMCKTCELKNIREEKMATPSFPQEEVNFDRKRFGKEKLKLDLVSQKSSKMLAAQSSSDDDLMAVESI